MGKTVSNVKSLDFGMNEVITDGVLTSDEKFVIAGIARPGNTEQWNVSQRNEGVQTQITMRYDMSLSLWDNENGCQGPAVIPYFSVRMMQTALAGGGGSQFYASSIDNDARGQRAQYKNLVVSEEINEAIKECLDYCNTKFIESVEKGEPLATTTRSSVKNADALIKAAAKVNALRPRPQAAQQQQGAASQGGVPQTAQDEKAKEFLNTGGEQK